MKRSFSSCLYIIFPSSLSFKLLYIIYMRRKRSDIVNFNHSFFLETKNLWIIWGNIAISFNLKIMKKLLSFLFFIIIIIITFWNFHVLLLWFVILYLLWSNLVYAEDEIHLRLIIYINLHLNCYFIHVSCTLLLLLLLFLIFIYVMENRVWNMSIWN